MKTIVFNNSLTLIFFAPVYPSRIQRFFRNEKYFSIFAIVLNIWKMNDIDFRHQYIKDQLEHKGIIRVQELADKFGVTGATIRRDLRILESQRALQRGYGHAVPVKGKAMDLPVSEKSRLHSFEKGKIAKAAAGLIEENDSFLITSGSTIDAFVRNLDAIGSHNVVTASIQVAAVLAEKSGFNAFILGGKVVKDSMSVRDNTAIEELRHIRCNKLFFGCDGLDLQGGVTSADINESRLNIAMMKSASQKILLADSSKIGKIGFGKTCELADIDVLVTDSGISRKSIEQISMLGVKLIIA